MTVFSFFLSVARKTFWFFGGEVFQLFGSRTPWGEMGSLKKLAFLGCVGVPKNTCYFWGDVGVPKNTCYFWGTYLPLRLPKNRTKRFASFFLIVEVLTNCSKTRLKKIMFY